MNRKSFTLIEMLVVIIIIGILASVAIPIMNNLKVKAICAEGLIIMGTLNNALKLYDTVNGHDADMDGYTGLLCHHPEFLPKLGLTPQDISGIYFGGPECICWDNGTVRCVTDPTKHGGPDNSAPRASETKSVSDSPDGFFTLYPDGHITQYHFSRSGYKYENWP